MFAKLEVGTVGQVLEGEAVGEIDLVGHREQRVAVGRRVGHGLGRVQPAGARPVVDHHRLAPALAQALGDAADQHIEPAARRHPEHDLHALVGKSSAPPPRDRRREHGQHGPHHFHHVTFPSRTSDFAGSIGPTKRSVKKPELRDGTRSRDRNRRSGPAGLILPVMEHTSGCLRMSLESRARSQARRLALDIICPLLFTFLKALPPGNQHQMLRLSSLAEGPCKGAKARDRQGKERRLDSRSAAFRVRSG